MPKTTASEKANHFSGRSPFIDFVMRRSRRSGTTTGALRFGFPFLTPTGRRRRPVRNVVALALLGEMAQACVPRADDVIGLGHMEPSIRCDLQRLAPRCSRWRTAIFLGSFTRHTTGRHAFTHNSINATIVVDMSTPQYRPEGIFLIALS